MIEKRATLALKCEGGKEGSPLNAPRARFPGLFFFDVDWRRSTMVTG